MFNRAVPLGTKKEISNAYLLLYLLRCPAHTIAMPVYTVYAQRATSKNGKDKGSVKSSKLTILTGNRMNTSLKKSKALFASLLVIPEIMPQSNETISRSAAIICRRIRSASSVMSGQASTQVCLWASSAANIRQVSRPHFWQSVLGNKSNIVRCVPIISLLLAHGFNNDVIGI